MQGLNPDGTLLGEYYVGPGILIQTAIDSASAGEIVYVYSGTYEENVTIGKMLTLYGEDVDTTIIAPASGASVELTADTSGLVDGVSLLNFTLTPGPGAAAFRALSGTLTGNDPDTTNLTLDNIYIADATYGMELNALSGATFTNLTLDNIDSPGGAGALELLGVANLTIEDSTFSNNAVAIRLQDTSALPLDQYGPNGAITIDNSLFLDNVIDIDDQDPLVDIDSVDNRIATTSAGDTQTVAVPDVGDVTMEIEPGTLIVGPADWDGIITPPTVVSTSVQPTTTPGYVATVQVSIEVGAGDQEITFDQAVRLMFENQANNLVGWSRNGDFTAITKTCVSLSDQSAINAQLDEGEDCKIADGDDLVVWTKHFTVFTTYTETEAPEEQEESSGGGGTVIRPVVAGASATTGEVLGAETTVFDRNLRVGDTGNDVSELQRILIAGGYLHIAAPTGYFGPLTLAAVKQYQTANAIIATGLVGPLTRAALAGATAATTGPSVTQIQIETIVKLLESYGTNAAAIAEVKKALGH